MRFLENLLELFLLFPRGHLLGCGVEIGHPCHCGGRRGMFGRLIADDHYRRKNPYTY